MHLLRARPFSFSTDARKVWTTGIPRQPKVASENLGDMKPVEGRKRVIIEEAQPQVDCHRYPATPILGDVVTITAAVVSAAHDHISDRLLSHHCSATDSQFTPPTPLSYDPWSAS